MQRFIFKRSATNIRAWSLAYFFIWGASDSHICFHFSIHLFVYIFLNCSSFKYFRLRYFNLVPKIIVIRGTYQFNQKMGITLYYIFWKFLYDLHCLLKLKRMTPYTPYRPQHASHCFQTCKEISAPIGAWKWNAFPFLFNHVRLTNQPTQPLTDQHTFGVIGKLK